MLDQASRAAPLAVILDDLHAAGRPSALLLRFAAAARLSRVLLLATYRTAEAAIDPDVSDVIAALESVSPPLILAGLSAADIRLMLPGADADVLAVVQRRSEGNPLFVSQVARLLGPGAAAVEEVPVPASIRQAVRRQVARLGDAANRRRHADRGRDPGHRGGARPGHRPGPGRGGAGRPARTGGPAVRPRHRDRPARPRPGRRRGVPVPARADQGDPLRRARAAVPGPGAPQDRRGARKQSQGGATPSWPTTSCGPRPSAPKPPPGRSGTPGWPARRRWTRWPTRKPPVISGVPWTCSGGRRRPPRPAGAALLLSLAEALTKTGPDPDAARVVDEAVRLARHADEPRLLAAAALLNAQHLDFNAPADTTAALLREAAAALDPADHALRARTLARLAITLASEPADARDAAEQAVQDAREAVTRDPDGRVAAAALATALAARHHVLWGSQDPADALAAADEWHDTERASRIRAEKDFLVRELTAATGLGGRPRRLGSDSERARLNVTRAIRTVISRIRDRAPDAAAHLDRAVRTGTRCSYSPPDRQS